MQIHVPSSTRGLLLVLVVRVAHICDVYYVVAVFSVLRFFSIHSRGPLHVERETFDIIFPITIP